MTEVIKSVGQAIRSFAKNLGYEWKRWKYVKNPQKFWERRGGKDNFQEYPPEMLHKEGVFFSEQLSKLQFTSALEVGCGHGRMLRYTIQNNGSRFIVGLDFGYPQLKKAQLALAGQCHLVQASALDLPFADNTFDLVYCVGVLMHIPPSSVQKTLSETVRVSRKYVLFAEGIYNHFNMFGLDFRKEYEAVGLKTLSCVLKPFQGLRPKPVQFAVMEKGASIK